MNFILSNRQNIFFSIISGLLLTLAFPKPGLFWLAFIALIPFFVVMNNCTNRQSIVYGLIFGLSHFYSLLIWVVYTLNVYGFIPIWLCFPILFLLALYLSLYTAFFSWFIVRFSKNQVVLLVLAPSLWVCLEFIRSHALTGFPWELLGYSQYSFLTLIQIADITGVYGVSFLIMLTNTSLFLLALFLKKNKWGNRAIVRKTVITAISVSAGLIIITCIYGYYRIDKTDRLAHHSESAVVSAIQGNIDQSLKWKKSNQIKTIDKYNDLSFAASLNKPDLIVWPETAAPFYYLYNKELTYRVTKGIQKTDTAYVIGSPSFSRENNKYIFFNSAYVATPGGYVIDKYDKVHLVPFGEYVPLKKFLPFINKLTEQVGDFLPGKKGKTINYKNLCLGIQICFEAVFPDLSREAVKNGANLIINMTNDAWFGRKSAPFQHFSMVVFRAVENKRAVVRSANTGISGFIDPVGRTLSTTDLYVDAHVTERLPLLNELTFYTQHGNLFSLLCFFPVIFAVIYEKYLKNKIFTSA